jgi:hypothetical protein
LRLYPAIPVFPREAAADDVLASGHPVSKGVLFQQPLRAFCMLLSAGASLH